VSDDLSHCLPPASLHTPAPCRPLRARL